MGPAETITNFYSYITAKDAESISKSYVESEELYVILEGPRLSNRGHANISKGWKDFCESGLSLEGIKWTEGPFEDIDENMAWVGGIVDLSVAVEGRTFTQTFRSTFVLRKEGDQWKIKHEHVSAAMEDPYGIGDWLKENA